MEWFDSSIKIYWNVGEPDDRCCARQWPKEEPQAEIDRLKEMISCHYKTIPNILQEVFQTLSADDGQQLNRYKKSIRGAWLFGQLRNLLVTAGRRYFNY